MRKITLVFTLAFCSIFLTYGQKLKLNMYDAVIGQYYKLAPEELNQLQWIAETNEFSYVEDYNTLVKSSVDKQTKEIVLEIEELNKLFGQYGVRNATVLPWAYSYHSDTTVNFEWLTPNTFQFRFSNRVFIYNTLTKSFDLNFKFEAAARRISFCREKMMLAYTKKNNLFISDSTETIKQITKDKDIDIVNGSDYVHRQEFGISKGIFWSPKGNFIAFYRKDETMVTDYPIVDITARVAKVENIKYPMAGMKSEEVTVGVYDINSQKTIFLQTGKPVEQYLTNISWGPNEEFIYIAVLNREQNHLKLNKYESKTGKFVKTLFEEEHTKYVEPEHPIEFLTTKPNKFIWQSERDGYNHIYLYDTIGNPIKQLTKGKWVVTEVLGFDDKEENIFIEATKESPLERHIYKVEISSTNITKITKAQGTHSCLVNSSGEFVIDEYSSMKTPNITKVVNTKGKTQRLLLNAINPLNGYEIGQTEMIKIKAADGKTDLYGRIIKPVDFDPEKKYPVIVYVYGGPHLQLVKNKWLGGAGMWDYYMAQKGYIMLTIDNRGSLNRGLKFENVIHRRLGVIEMQDQMKGIEYLQKLPYVDNQRIGVFGWSFGGFMTTSLMVNHPKVFKVGVAGGPVIDWKYYEVMYGERYMDTPLENLKGYEKTSLLPKAKDLKGKLLMIHGAVDPVVVMQNSQTFVRECIKEGILIDYFIYPTHKHNVRGFDRIHLMRKVTQYFDTFL